ncbi:unnamed protein product [Brassicogethes aeneus]|uniref:Uncharacterized protein n=1 Tax=Brassicogethes aeneus TaxID=1431903 RepID=A0A9P0ASN9_BRAAE|nr:unnamed protein product [Brassicogethes aeneus]
MTFNFLQKINSNRDKINIKELERLSANKVYDFIDGFTDDMAQQSDVGGDSDAKDTVLVSIPGSPGTSCSSIILTPDPSISSTPLPGEVSDDANQEDFGLPEVEVSRMESLFSDEFQIEDVPENEEEVLPDTNLSTDFPMKWTKNLRFQEKIKNFNQFN